MRPLLICDCDEVLLHMVRHFGVWLDEAHDIELALHGVEFEHSMRRRPDGAPVPPGELWGLLDAFFPAEMGRQTLVPHAREALDVLAGVADVVILTNLQNHCREPRIEQLAAHRIAHRVECNQGPKGPAVARLVAEHDASVAVFVDDLPQHHQSVADTIPGVHQLHMVSEPEVAAPVARAPAAHARIDDWRVAAAWIAARFEAGVPADA